MAGLTGFLVVLCMLKYSDAQIVFSGPGTVAAGATTAPGVAETSTASAALFTVATTGGTGAKTYVFETDGNPSSVAAIDGTTGAVTLAIGKSIDYETTKSLTFKISATDTTGAASKVILTVTLPITNKLEFAKAKYGVCATDGATAGTAIATYVVADAATGDTVGYTITAGNAAGDLAVGPTTGALTVATGKTLSQTTTGGYTVTITATATVTTGTASAVGTTDVWIAICSTTCSGVGHVTALIGVLLLGLLAACNI